MLGWLVKKGQNSRVYMCVKEVKWEVEAADATRRASLLALAQLYRVELFDEYPGIASAIDRPLDFGREDLMRFYEMLEDIRNAANLNLESTQKTFRRLGGELPDFAVKHAKLTTRALEIWMCTVGAGIQPSLRDDVRAIWRDLQGASKDITKGIDHLREVESRTAATTGGSGPAMFAGVDTDRWIEVSKYVPAGFSKELRL
ncbi:MAG: hypothetical protein IPK81_18585 [Rhodospirillales bacterium]|nr:MAG: hypothetical protein IPK81_18585 [Rhodospirillales bacterium]